MNLTLTNVRIGQDPACHLPPGEIIASFRGQRAFVAYVEDHFAFRFFRRMHGSLEERGWTLVLVTHLLSVYQRARSSKIVCFLISSQPIDRNSSGVRLENTREFLQHLISAASAGRFQAAVARELRRMCQIYPSCVIGLLNGFSLAGQAATAFARDHSIPTCFFELGNIDSTLFVDPEGVNSASRIAHNPTILNHFEISDDEIAEWTKHFIERRIHAGVLSQARWMRKLNSWFPIDWFGTVVLRIPQPMKVSMRSRLLSKLSVFRIHEAPCREVPKPYIFLPLQVSTDSNLLLFSNYDNLDAIAYAAQRARQVHCNLVIKPHPAEPSFALIEKVSTLCREHGYVLTGRNTTELLLGANEVVTVNSTVGLKAILYGKQVTVLGSSLYGSFSRHQAGAYVLRYLIDFNPFGTTPMSKEVLDRVLGAADTIH